MTPRRARLVLLLAILAGVVGLGTAMARSRRPDPEKHFASRDIRLHLPHPADMTGWTQVKEFDEEKEKEYVLRLVMKKPDSSDPFDVILNVRGWEHNLKLTFTDEATGGKTEIAASSVQQLTDFLVQGSRKLFKDIKDEEKFRKKPISPSVGKGYVWTITGLQEGTPLPIHLRVYGFDFSAKTYVMTVLMTTTSVKNEAIVKAVDGMIAKMVAWKP